MQCRIRIADRKKISKDENPKGRNQDGGLFLPGLQFPGLDKPILRKEYSRISSPRGTRKYFHKYQKQKTQHAIHRLSEKNKGDLLYRHKFQESEDLTHILSVKELNIISHEWESILNIAEDVFNEKTKVPLNAQHLLLEEAATASSITNAAKTFQKVK